MNDADVVEDLYSWISRWAGEIMNLETVRKSIVMASALLQEFNYFRKFYGDTVAELVKPRGVEAYLRNLRLSSFTSGKRQSSI